MIATICSSLLVLALSISLFAIVMPVLAKWNHHFTPERYIPFAAIASCVVITSTFLLLVIAYAISDFSVLNVALNSHSLKPMLYKITGTWGNHEGSMLLWAWVLSLYSAAYALWGRGEEKEKYFTLLSQHFLFVGIAAFIVFTSNPFVEIYPVPLDGQGLNPLLQDIGLALHPPMLYMGYVGFSIIFSSAVAGLLTGNITSVWARAIKPWVLVAWSFLTMGIGLGSWWAYRELGWGGFWFWDPVENASFMPWLAGTALLHSLLILEKRETLKSWTVLLALLTFSLSLIGTFLVRSGVLTSVHAFANDPERGLFILLFLVVVVGVSLTLFALRAHLLKPTDYFAAISRETLLLFNNMLLLVACGVVLLGTLYPLLLEVISGEKISVGAPYFNATFNPIALLLLVLAAITPAIHWKKDEGKRLYQTQYLPIIISIISTVAITLLAGMKGVIYVAGLGIGIWLIVSMIVLWFKKIEFFKVSWDICTEKMQHISLQFYAMMVAHIGAGIMVIGITVVSGWSLEQEQSMQLQDKVQVGNYTMTLKEISPVAGKNYIAEIGKFSLQKPNGDEIDILHPERRFYPVEGEQTTESGIHSTLFYDFYAVLGKHNETGYATRFYYRPFMNWIWIGCILMAVGGAIALIGAIKKQGKANGTPRI